MSSIRIAFIVMLGVITLTVVIAGGTSKAAGTVARWQLYERASATTPFLAGAVPLDPPATGAGYEIVSFDAVPLATGLVTYVYGGSDLPVALGGPASPIVVCSADFTAAAMNLHVSGAYPYAGCVFYLGATNIGDAPITVELGGLTAEATVTCNAPGCQASDVEMLAGGPDAAAIGALCRFDGTVNPGDALLQFDLDPGASVICPVFVIVLQPAAEGATYSITVIPPPAGPATGGPQAGVISTPVAPASGTGLVTYGPEGSRLWIGYLALSVAIVVLVLAWPRRRS